MPRIRRPARAYADERVTRQPREGVVEYHPLPDGAFTAEQRRRMVGALYGYDEDNGLTRPGQPDTTDTVTKTNKEPNVNINNAFPSKWLKSGDIPEQGDLVLTIKNVTIEEVGQDQDAEQKPVVYFNETGKGLVLNKTNANVIAGLYGPETNGWTGQRIGLYATEVQFGSQTTLAIRVRMKAPTAGNGNGAYLSRDEAVALLESVGLNKDALREALVKAGSVNSEGKAAYVAERDTALVRQLVAANTPEPEPF